MNAEEIIMVILGEANLDEINQLDLIIKDFMISWCGEKFIFVRQIFCHDSYGGLLSFSHCHDCFF